VAILRDFEKLILLDDQFEMAKGTDCKLELYSSISEWISAQETIINNLEIRDITFDAVRGNCYIVSNIPNMNELQNILLMLKVTKSPDTVETITSHLVSFHATVS
jgi:hypothetical protein